MDYLIGSGAWRPNIGAAYLGDKNYADFTVGWNLKTGMVDFGLGGGYADTEEDNKITCPVGFTLIGSTCFMNT
jgi:hypothetical protein